MSSTDARCKDRRMTDECCGDRVQGMPFDGLPNGRLLAVVQLVHSVI